jgi:hypothetical protein
MMSRYDLNKRTDKYSRKVNRKETVVVFCELFGKMHVSANRVHVYYSVDKKYYMLNSDIGNKNLKKRIDNHE